MADSNITWNGTPISDIHRDALSLQKINENGTVEEMIDTINSNFLEIAKHGGGPAGLDGSNGLDGVDGVNAEFIYALCDSIKQEDAGTKFPGSYAECEDLFNRVNNDPSHSSAYKGNVVWFDHPQGVSYEHKNEYVFSRYRTNEESQWYYAPYPALWSHWGETGRDGDGVEYIFMRSTSELDTPALSTKIFKVGRLSSEQQIIYNIDDFYPGDSWFQNSNNALKAYNALKNNGYSYDYSAFLTRFQNQYFGFPSVENNWTDNPTGTDATYMFEYVSIRRSNTDESGKKTWGDYSVPALWATYSKTSRTFIIYTNTETKEDGPAKPTGGHWNVGGDPEFTPPTGWNNLDVDDDNKPFTWISSGIFDSSGVLVGEWSDPICITGPSGQKGEDGSFIEFIYVLIPKDTLTPDVDYPTNDEDKKDLFDRIENATKVNGKKSVIDHGWEWCDNAQPISPENHTEYMWLRQRTGLDNEGHPNWVYTDKPVIWAHWGEDGTDGDGVEYIFHLSDTKVFPSSSEPVKIADMTGANGPYLKAIFNLNDFYPGNDWFNKTITEGGVTRYPNKEKALKAIQDNPDLDEEYFENNWAAFIAALDKGWTDNPQGTSANMPYEFVSIRRCDPDAEVRTWSDFCEPAQWSYYGKATRVFMVYCNMDEGTTPVPPTGGFWNFGSTPDLTISSTNLNPYKCNALQNGYPGGVNNPNQWTNHVGYWEDNNNDVTGKISWSASGVFTEDGALVSWSKPHRMTGETGSPGEDGAGLEFIYAREDTMTEGKNYPHKVRSDDPNEITVEKLFDLVEGAQNNPKSYTYTDNDDYTGHTHTGTTTVWHDNALAISKSHKIVYAWSRHKDSGLDMPWDYDPEPFIWSRWGEDGQDGDGIEYIFLSADHNTPHQNEIPIKKSALEDDYQRAIFNLNEFVPGQEWFDNPENKATVRQMFPEYSDFETRWAANFGMCPVNSGWKDNPGDVSPEMPYELVSIRKSKNDAEGKRVWGDFGDPVVWSNYGKSTRTFIVYCNMVGDGIPATPENGWWNVEGNELDNGESDSDDFRQDVLDYQDRYDIEHSEVYGVYASNIGYWDDDDIDVPNTITWISSGTFDESGELVGEWSKPHRITGEKGQKGADGSDIEFIYALTDNPQYPKNSEQNAVAKRNALFDAVEDPDNITTYIPGSTKYTTRSEVPSSNIPSIYAIVDEKCVYYNGTEWFDRAQLISTDDKIEYCVSRRMPAGDNSAWIPDETPFVWAHWGEDGTDGDGIEYIFMRSTTAFVPAPATWYSYADIDSLNPALTIYEMGIYQIDDFVPISSWFDGNNSYNKTAHKDAVRTYVESAGTLWRDEDYDTAWTSMRSKFSFDNISNFGTWYDNPQDLSSTYQYQYVSVRKSPDGVWGKFSYPTLWSKYNVAQFKSIVFTNAKVGVDLSGAKNTINAQSNKGTFANPVPGDTTYPAGTTYQWHDNPQPTADDEVVWMIAATFREDHPNGPYSDWSAPQKMSDRTDFNVEWSANDLSVEQVTAINSLLDNSTYNFGRYLTLYGNESDAEQHWRADVETLTQQRMNVTVSFNDTPGQAYLMATCQLTNGNWSNWKVVRVKGEQGDPGRSITVTGRITHELYLGANDTYNWQAAEDALTDAITNNSFAHTPVNGEFLAVYPHNVTDGVYWGDDSKGGAIYVFKYVNGSWIDYSEHLGPNNPSDNGEILGNSYGSINSHLLYWDDDSWQDLGELCGPEGPEGKTWAVHVRYAKDDPNDATKKIFVNNEDIPTAKWIGIKPYQVIQGFDPNTFTVDAYTWSLFKGQDGYGYEYIFWAGNTNVAPRVPETNATEDATDDFQPDKTYNGVRYQWDDDPIEPTVNNKYVWMCWRKHDGVNGGAAAGSWGKFRGAGGRLSNQSGAVARLWQVYARSITDVQEYFYTSTTMSPDWSNIDASTSSSIDTTIWKSKSQVTWDETNRYLFNREVVVYSDNLKTVLDPHLIAVYDDGVEDWTDYYILESEAGTNNNYDPGEDAPGLDGNGDPITSGTQQTEGTGWWTTNVAQTKMSTSFPVLWNVTKKIYRDKIPGTNTNRTGWSSPIVVGVFGQGQNGEDSIYIDLDNEMDSIQVRKEKVSNVYKYKILKTRTFKTTLKLYRGSTPMKIKDLDITGETGFTTNASGEIISSDNLDSSVTFTRRYCVPIEGEGDVYFIDNPDGSGYMEEGVDYLVYQSLINDSRGMHGASSVEITFTLNKDALLTSEYTKVVFIATSVDTSAITNGSFQRMASYTLAGTTYPTVYDIVASTTEIVYKDNGENANPRYTKTPDSLAVDIVERSLDNDPITYSSYSSSQKFQVKYITSTGASKTFNSTGSFAVTSAHFNALSAGDYVKFEIAVDADGNSANGNETILDRETIFVLREGTDGKPGAAGKGYQYRYARYNDATPCSIATTQWYENEPVVYFGAQGNTVSTYPDMSGVDESNCYEYRIERTVSSTTGRWSEPRLIGKYLTVANISSEVSAAVLSATASINNTLASTTAAVNRLSGYFDNNGKLQSGIASSLMSGYLTYNSSSEVVSIIDAKIASLSLGENGSIDTLAAWIDYENDKFTSIGESLDPEQGIFSQYATQVELDKATAAFDTFKVDAHDQFATMERTIANASFLTDTEGSLLVNIPDYVTWFKTTSDIDNSEMDSDSRRNMTWVLCKDTKTVNETETYTYTYAPYMVDGDVTKVSTLYDETAKVKPIFLQLDNISYSAISADYFSPTGLKKILHDGLTIGVNMSDYTYSIVSNSTGLNTSKSGSSAYISTIFTSTSQSSGRVKLIAYTTVATDYDVNQSSENNYIYSNLDWSIGVVAKASNNTSGIEFAYMKTASIFDEPKFNSLATSQEKENDVYEHLELYGSYGYTLKNVNGSYIPTNVNGTVSIAENTPQMYLIPDDTPLANIMAYLNNGTPITGASTFDSTIPVNTSNKYYYVVSNNSGSNEYNYSALIDGDSTKNVLTFPYTYPSSTTETLFKDKHILETGTTQFTDYNSVLYPNGRQYTGSDYGEDLYDNFYSLYITSKYDVVDMDRIYISSYTRSGTARFGVYVDYKINNGDVTSILVRELTSTSSSVSATNIKNILNGVTLSPGQTLHFRLHISDISGLTDTSSLNVQYKFGTESKIMDNGTGFASSKVANHGNSYIFAINNPWYGGILRSNDITVSNNIVSSNFWDVNPTGSTSSGNVNLGDNRDIISVFEITATYKNTRVKLTFDNPSTTGTLRYMIVPAVYNGPLLNMLKTTITNNISSPNSSSVLNKTNTSETLGEPNGFLNAQEFGTIGKTSSSWTTITRNSTPSITVDFNDAFNGSGTNTYRYTVILHYRYTGGNEAFFPSFTQTVKCDVLNQIEWKNIGSSIRCLEHPIGFMIDKIKVSVGDRSVADTFEDSRRPAKSKSNPNQSASSYIDVLDEEKPYLVSSVTELATISQMVSDGIASTEIIVGVGEHAATQVFQATRDGSQIYMNADEIGIESKYFKLNNDGLSMKGNLYAQDQYGNITAGVIGENISDENDIKFFAGTSILDENNIQLDIQNAPFRVYENGHIVANDIEISAENGNTILDEIGLHSIESKTTTITVDEVSDLDGYESLPDGDYTGDISIETTLNSYGLSIVANGTLKHTNNTNSLNISGNRLYIKYFDRIKNPDVDDSLKPMYGKDYLYGVPVLCMWYMGQEYIMSPGSWMTDSNNSGGDTSNMRWIRAFPVYLYTYNSPGNSYSPNYVKTTSLTNATNGFQGTCYLFRNGYGSSGQYGTPFISNLRYEDMYRIDFINLGKTTAIEQQNIADITGDPYYLSSGTTVTDVKNNAAMTLYSNITNKGYTGYGSQTVINTDNLAIYAGYVPDTCVINNLISVSYPSMTYVVPDNKYGLSNIIEFMRNNIKGTHSTYDDYIWDYPQPLSSTGYVRLFQLTGLLPFDNGYDNSNEYRKDNSIIKLNIYPLLTLGNKGKTMGTSVTRILVQCEVGITSAYSNYPGCRIDIWDCQPTGYNLYPESQYKKTVYIKDMTFTLKFDMVLEISAITYNEQTILNKIDTLLKTYDFSALRTSNYFNFIDFSGMISIYDNGTYSYVRTRVQDNY